MTGAIAVPADFDAGIVPPWRLLRAAPAEIRAVATSIRDALHEARMVAFRSGAHVIAQAEIAVLICERPDVLERTLPEIVQRGFAAYDDDGALYSPQLLARALRRQERARLAAERAERQAAIDDMVAAGELPPETTLQAVANRVNARRGGRPRKGETPEEARLRRDMEAATADDTQRSLRLLRSVGRSGVETQIETENRNGFSKGGFSVSPVSLDLDVERDINLSGSDSPETPETENPETPVPEIPPAQLAAVADQVLREAGWSRDVLPRQMGAIRKWLQSGCPADVLIEAVRSHTAAMHANKDEPKHMGAFKFAIPAAWEAHKALALMPDEAVPTERDMPEWERLARQHHREDTRLFAEIAAAEGSNYSQVLRRWAERARELGRPVTDRKLESYLDAYRQRAQAA